MGPSDIAGEPFFNEMLSGVLDHYDELDAEGLAFHRQRWWPAEVRLSAVHAVAYAAVLATALCWAWASHLEAAEAVAAQERLVQKMDRHNAAEAAIPLKRQSFPVLQPTPLWTLTGAIHQPLFTPSTATKRTFRTVATTPYRGTF
jgi:hypothetical protein